MKRHRWSPLLLLLPAFLAHGGSEFVRPPFDSCKPYEGLVDNKDGTLTDPRSGLVWSRCDLGTHFVKGKGCVGEQPRRISWAHAMKLARDDRTGGFSTWRLPTADEIRSIVAPAGHCVRHYETPERGTAAVDLRMLIQQYYDSDHPILQLEVHVHEYVGYGIRAYEKNLRTGTRGATSESSHPLTDRGAFVRLVRQAGPQVDPNLTKARELHAEYIDQPAALAEQQRQQRNAEADRRARQERERDQERKRTLDAAKE